MQARRRVRIGCGRAGGLVFALVFLVMWFAVARAKPKGPNVHQPDADCTTCHTAARARLEANPAAARALLVPDIDARCSACHDDEGPSHRTEIRPRGAVPTTLPLSANGLITCATCHFVHGTHNPYGDFVRVDNSRGGLCLSCHQLSELE